MIRLVLAAALIVFLPGWPSLLAAAESPCAGFPAGSISRRECERNVSKQKEEERVRESQRQILDIQMQTGLEPWLCDTAGGAAITNVVGSPGGRVSGTYRNLSPDPTRKMEVGFQFYGPQGDIVGQVRAPVTPGALKSGDSGTFVLNVPDRQGNPDGNVGAWACFRFVFTDATD